LDSSPESVHLESYPTVNKELIRPDLEESVDLMNTLVMLGRNHREKIGVKAKIPLKSLRIIHRNSQVLNRLKLLENYFKDELNVREVIYDSNEDAMVQISVKPNFPVLGKRFGAQMKAAASEIQGFQLDQILRLEKGEEIQVLGQPVTLADVEIRRVAKDNRPDLVTHQKISIEMDRTVTEEQQLEGLAREIIRKIQAKRKEADLNYDDRIHIQIALEGRLFIAATTHQQMIQKEALCTKWDYSSSPEGQWIEDTEIDGEKIRFGIRLA
jgi:isoleucyl-tRNA synthetase